LSWALHLLANSPDVQERLHREAEASLDLASDDAGAVKDLALARNVFRETLRLFPPVGFLARQCTHAQILRDKAVQAGASVMVSPWLIQRHRELWARPDEFDPDRFERESEDGGTPPVRESLRRAYLPFGMGPRVCIGAAFALQESALVLAVLAREFRFEPVAGAVPEPVGRLTIRSENGIRLRVFRRERSA
jgi:cytochrome P450